MKKTLIFITIMSASMAAKAQFEKIIQPSDLKQKTIVTEPTTLKKGYLRAELGVLYLVQDKYFNSSGEKEYYPVSMWGSKYQYTIGLKYGFTDRFEVDIYVPVVNQRIENYFILKMPVVNSDMSISSKLKGQGLGDCNLMVKYQILQERGRRITLSIFGDVMFPTGPKNPSDIKDFNDYKLPTGAGYFSAGLWLYARKIVYPYSFTTLINYYHNFEGSKLMDADATSPTRFKKGDRIMAGGSFNIHLNEWIALGNELYYFHFLKGSEWAATRISTKSGYSLDYVPRLVFQVRRFRISEIVSVPLMGKDNSADPGYSMSLQYTF